MTVSLDARTLSADLHALTSSSPSTGTAPGFAPVATQAEPTSATPDAAVIRAAHALAKLAQREWAAVGRDCEAEHRQAVSPTQRHEIAARAAYRLSMRLNRRLMRDCRSLAALKAVTVEGAVAKARAVLAVESATDADEWWDLLRASALLDVAQLTLPTPVQADNTDDASQPTDDADLLQRLAEIEAIHVQRQAFDVSGDEGEDPFYEAFWEASDALAAVPATTLRGLAAKGRAAQITKSYDVGLECRNCGSFTGLAASMMRDVAAMAQVASEAYPSRKATIEDYAQCEFKAWDMSDFTPPSQEEWAKSYNPHGVSLHLATGLLSKDKAELVSAVRPLWQRNDDTVESFLRSLDGSFAYFEAMSKVINAARFRFVGACSMLELEEETADTAPCAARVA